MDIYVNYFSHEIKLSKVNIKLDIFDTYGAWKYNKISLIYIKNSAGLILVYDISNKDSYNNWV